MNGRFWDHLSHVISVEQIDYRAQKPHTEVDDSLMRNEGENARQLDARFYVLAEHSFDPKTNWAPLKHCCQLISLQQTRREDHEKPLLTLRSDSTRLGSSCSLSEPSPQALGGSLAPAEEEAIVQLAGGGHQFDEAGRFGDWVG